MPEQHFYEQRDHTDNYLVPFFKKHIKNFQNLKVLEVGCAEAGLMDRLSELGFEVTGVEIDPERAKIANEKNKNLNVIVGDISDPKIVEQTGNEFDFIIMREVIEHVIDKETAFANLNKLLKEGGYLFVSFPPKYSPFAGHQQVGLSILKAVPYIHMLPKKIITLLAKLFKEHQNFPHHVKFNYSTGCSIRNFEKLYKKNGFSIVIKEFFLFRPIYKLRFGLPLIKIPNLPLIREILSFGCETLLRKNP